MDNEIIEYRDWDWWGMPAALLFVVGCGGAVSYKGRRIVRGNNRVLLFDHCEYCGGRTLDKRDCCTQCGAPALRDFYGIG
jgi:hypothetical protein